MSGIAGIIHFDRAPSAPRFIEAMTSAMVHRGPDGIQHWVKGSVALGQCMLRTTPESLEEYQPLPSEDASLVLVMDGWVSNWEELRRELLARGAALRDRSDAELVLRAYESWGQECLAHIDGDFALVIWDARRQQAFCARDRMGNKPFYYHWDGKTFAFASELRAILALPWIRQEPNEGMLAERLAEEWLSKDETPWSGIMRLVAAHRMVAGASGPRPNVYWEPDVWATLPFRKDEEYFEHYRELLADIVRRLSRSHKPVAIDVSGGLDSSSVFCLAEYLRRAGKLLAPGIEGYTAAFAEEDGEAYELAYARAVGDYCGLKIHEVAPSRMPVSWFAERARADRDFPFFPNAAMFVDLRRQTAAQGSRVALSGEGGDFWLLSSRTYYAEELAQRHWPAVLDCFRADVKAFGVWQAMGWLVRWGFLPLFPPAFKAGIRRLIQPMEGGARDCYWLSPRMREAISLRRRQRLPRQRPMRSIGQRGLLGTLSSVFYAYAIETHERLAAHSGLEIRQPFNDPRFVQYALSTPDRLRLRGDRTKYIHVQALQNFMPRSILKRKSKAEFSLSFRWHLDQMQETLTGTVPRDRPDWVDAQGMARLFRAYHDDPQAGWQLWILWSIYGCDMVYR